MSYESPVKMFDGIAKKFRNQLLSNIIDGKLVMDADDVLVRFDNLFRFACSAMIQSANNNVRLKTRNTILETNCVGLRRERDVSRKNEQIEQLKRDIIDREKKIQDLTDDIRSVREEDNKRNGMRQTMQEEMVRRFIDTNNELQEGKMLIAAQINKLEGNGDDVGNLRFSELIGLLTMCVIRLKEDDDGKINEDFRQLQRTVDDLQEDNEYLTTLTEEYQNDLAAKDKMCAENDKRIETLKSNVVEGEKNKILIANKYGQAVVRINNLTNSEFCLKNKIKLLEERLKQKSSLITRIAKAAEEISWLQVAEFEDNIKNVLRKFQEFEAMSANNRAEKYTTYPSKKVWLKMERLISMAKRLVFEDNTITR